MGIGDGFIPDLVDMSAVDEVARVSTAEAQRVAQDIRAQEGFCVGISSGANMAVALELRKQGLAVATLWPDSADRYASVGLAGTAAGEVGCWFKPFCEARGHALLGVSGHARADLCESDESH